jgi:TetR/AcrR family transcriptional repressor of mexJK operon
MSMSPPAAAAPPLVPVPDMPCGRRAQRRAERREAIVDVAYRWFMDQGYAATSMSAIAAELGGSKATLWNYFPSKELLFAAVLDRGAKTFQSNIARELTGEGDLAEVLGGFVHAFLLKVTSAEGLALYRMIVAEAGRFPELGRIFQERAGGRTRAVLAGYLAGAMAMGRLRAGDPLRAAYELLGLCMIGTHQQMLFGQIEQAPPGVLEVEGQAAVAVFLRAYAP